MLWKDYSITPLRVFFCDESKPSKNSSSQLELDLLELDNNRCISFLSIYASVMLIFFVLNGELNWFDEHVLMES